MHEINVAIVMTNNIKIIKRERERERGGGGDQWMQNGCKERKNCCSLWNQSS